MKPQHGLILIGLLQLVSFSQAEEFEAARLQLPQLTLSPIDGQEFSRNLEDISQRRIVTKTTVSVMPVISSNKFAHRTPIKAPATDIHYSLVVKELDLTPPQTSDLEIERPR